MYIYTYIYIYVVHIIYICGSYNLNIHSGLYHHFFTCWLYVWLLETNLTVGVPTLFFFINLSTT